MRMPLCVDPWNEGLPGLFMGGHDVRSQSPTACVAGDGSDLVVSLTAREGYGPSPEVEHVVARLGAPVAAAVRDGKRVLVRCSPLGP